MSNRKKQRMIIGVLSVILIGMAVGYGAINQLLKINGTSGIFGDFNIQFTKIEEFELTDSTTISKGGVGTTEANFTVDLKKPGSKALYELEITNKGTIDAVLTEVMGITEANNTAPTDIMIGLCEDEYCVDEFMNSTSLNVPLKAGESVTYYVKVYWDSNATTISTTDKTFSLKLTYEQFTTPAPRPVPETCFKAKEGVIIDYICEEKAIIIPSAINDVKITTIGLNSMSREGLTNVIIPEGIININEGAFYANELTNIEIPNSVTSIDARAFQSNQLTSIDIPNSVTSIGDSAFAWNGLTSVEIPNSVTSIGKYAFQNNQLTSVIIPDSVTSIETATFRDNQLTSVEIPNSVTSIGSAAFQRNQLTNVTLGSSIESIGTYAFASNQLTSIIIPESVTSIDDRAFQTNQLTSVDIPNSVTSIGDSAFAWNGLTSVTIGTGVTSIGSYAFFVTPSSNPNLTKIINKTGRPFDWYDITGQGSSSSAVTGTYGQVVISSE